jgi:hypothetical protein
MSEISRSVQFSKQAKILLTVQSIQPMCHDRTNHTWQVTWHDADVTGDELANRWQSCG